MAKTAIRRHDQLPDVGSGLKEKACIRTHSIDNSPECLHSAVLITDILLSHIATQLMEINVNA